MCGLPVLDLMTWLLLKLSAWFLFPGPFALFPAAAGVVLPGLRWQRRGDDPRAGDEGKPLLVSMQCLVLLWLLAQRHELWLEKLGAWLPSCCWGSGKLSDRRWVAPLSVFRVFLFGSQEPFLRESWSVLFASSSCPHPATWNSATFLDNEMKATG